MRWLSVGADDEAFAAHGFEQGPGEYEWPGLVGVDCRGLRDSFVLTVWQRLDEMDSSFVHRHSLDHLLFVGAPVRQFGAVANSIFANDEGVAAWACIQHSG